MLSFQDLEETQVEADFLTYEAFSSGDTFRAHLSEEFYGAPGLFMFVDDGFRAVIRLDEGPCLWVEGGKGGFDSDAYDSVEGMRFYAVEMVDVRCTVED